MLSDELEPTYEAELRAAIKPQYEDVRGTESYERKRLLGEIDRLRTKLKKAQDASVYAMACIDTKDKRAELAAAKFDEVWGSNA